MKNKTDTSFNRNSQTAPLNHSRITFSKNKRVLLLDLCRTNKVKVLEQLRGDGFTLSIYRQPLSNLFTLIETLRPQVLMLRIKELNRCTLETLTRLQHKNPLPVILFAESDKPYLAEQTLRAGICVYIVDKIRPRRFSSILSMAIARFEANQQRDNELEQVKRQLLERKTIERAKGELMSHQNLSEPNAYRHMRTMAMNSNLSLVRVAQNIIAVLSSEST